MSISTRPPSESPSAGERTPGVNDPGERERLMADFSIAYNGRHYEYDIYRYDHLADAGQLCKAAALKAASRC